MRTLRCWTASPSAFLALVLLLTGVLIFAGEVGIFYLYSWMWQWPGLDSLSGLVRHHTGLRRELHLSSATERYHYQSGDVHYYTRFLSGDHDSPEGYVNRPNPTILLRVLILSDPHIMCTYDKDEFGISRWDADRYLASSYSYLLGSLESPDMIILLGDIFSDGFHASEQQWDDYMECLKKVFPPPPDVKQMFILGDNDIGGERNDLMTQQVIERATSAFGGLNVVETVRGVKFMKLTTPCFVNGDVMTKAELMCRSILKSFLLSTALPGPGIPPQQPQEKKQQQQKHQQKQQQQLLKGAELQTPRIALSHIPLYSAIRPSFRHMVLHAGFDYVISGHIHHENYTTHVHRVYDEGMDGTVEKRARVLKLTHEITVPTCSYRMGEAHPGVGAMVIDSNGDVSYRVLWLPQRYPIFAGYLLALVALVLILCFRSRNCHRGFRRML